jgi:tetratricopeptide (TPR) repeat protein
MSASNDCLAARERAVRRVLSPVILTFVVGALAVCAWQFKKQPPSLDLALELVHAGKLDEAATRIRTILSANPDHAAANVLLAQILLKRTDPAGGNSPSSGSAEEALAHLGRVRPTSARMAVASLLCRGNALDRLLRLDEAEEAWLEAIDIDSTAPEVGFNLLNLYYIQGREEEARRLALRLFNAEPDRHDRALLLLELIRPDARPPAPASIIKWLEPRVAEHPGDMHSSIALGLAQVRAGQIENGIAVLSRVVETHHDKVEAWDSLLLGLDESGQVHVMEQELERVPAELAGAPKLLKHRARTAQGRNWKDAVDLYLKARQAEPYNRVVEYRLSRALRHVGQAAEADVIKERVRRRDIAIQELRPLYDQATDIPDLQVGSHRELCQQIAKAREDMQLPDEAIAWHRLVLDKFPENEVSLQAIKRLANQDHREKQY